MGSLDEKGFMRGRILANLDLAPELVTGTSKVLGATPEVFSGLRDNGGAGLVGKGGGERRDRVADGLVRGVEVKGASGRRKLGFNRPVPTSSASPVALAICPLMKCREDSWA